MWSIDTNMVSKIWVGMSTTNIHLLQSKIQSHLRKTRTLDACTSELTLYMKKNRLKFLTLHSSKKGTWTKLPSSVLWSLIFLDEIIRCTSKWFIPTQRTHILKFVNLKCDQSVAFSIKVVNLFYFFYWLTWKAF